MLLNIEKTQFLLKSTILSLSLLQACDHLIVVFRKIEKFAGIEIQSRWYTISECKFTTSKHHF